jgi:hypothetical protein
MKRRSRRRKSRRRRRRRGEVGGEVVEEGGGGGGGEVGEGGGEDGYRLFPGGKRPERGLNHPLVSRLKKEYSYTFPPLWAFTDCSRANFTF